MSKLENFKLENTTCWSFKERGDWATHDGKYRGNWSPYVPRNIILRYSKEKDLILDQFVGGGTTMVEAKLLNRDAIGIDVNKESLYRTRDKLNFNCDSNSKIKLILGDATNMVKIENESIDLICTHPPYAGIIKYSSDIKNDLSLLSLNDFYKKMNDVASESFRVLKPNKYCAVLMGDMRKNGFIEPLGFNVMNLFLKNGFKLKEIVIKKQHNCKATSEWEEKSKIYNFLLLEHEYLFIFKKTY